MVRLADLSALERDSMLQKIPDLPQFEHPAWVAGPPLARRRVALVTTAGLSMRGDKPFGAGRQGLDYRVIPGDASAHDLVMSHQAASFDRTGFQADWNVAFPLDRLRELVVDGLIGSISRFHYSFMGAIWPVTQYETKARELAALLHADDVDAVMLTPV